MTYEAEKLARRIIELDRDPAAIELSAHLTRQFEAGFKAGIEAAAKVADEKAKEGLHGSMWHSKFSRLASAIRDLAPPSDMVAVPVEPTPEEIEWVAEAIWQQDSIRVAGTRRLVPWAEAGSGIQETARWQARAAITALRAMLAAHKEGQ